MKAGSEIQTVSEITRRIKQILEGGFPSVSVQGELSNCKLHTSGHFYFTLKDDHAQINGVMWRSRMQGMSFSPEDGMKVIATGRLAVYEVRGMYQIDASALRPLGVGDLQIAFEKLKQKLSEEGLFETSRKRLLPPMPSRIGIITSDTGAVLHDILSIFRKRFPGLTVILRPARVQGPGAAQDIADAIEDFNRFGSVDLLIVGRGGGSLEDLWAFNEEIVARAIVASRVPVVSAVGHEVDFTIADFVADVRAPTPTAAAQLVVPDRTAILENLREYSYTMRHSVSSTLDNRRKQIRNILKSYAFNRPIDLLRQFNQRFDELTRSLVSSTGHLFALDRIRQTTLHQRMLSLDPRRVLQRGYVLVKKEGSIISTSSALHPPDKAVLVFHDGEVPVRILEGENRS